MGYYSTHEWGNGAVTTVQRTDDGDLNLRIQDPQENMLCDVVIGEYEALCLAHSILSVATHPEVEDE